MVAILDNPDGNIRFDEALIARKVLAERVQVFADRSFAGALTSPLGTVFLAWLAAVYAGPGRALVWLTLINLVELLIVLDHYRYRRSPGTLDLDRRMWRLNLLNFLAGLAWGASPWFFGPEVHYEFYLFNLGVLVSVAGISVMIMSPSRTAIALFYAGLLLLPIANLAATSIPHATELAIGLIVLYVLLMQYGLVAGRELTALIETSVRNSILTEQMSLARDAISASNRELAERNTQLSGTLEQLHRSEEEMRLASSVYESSSEAILVADRDNRIVAVNPAFTKLTGYTLAEVLGRDPRLLKSGRQDIAFYGAMWRSINETGQWQGELWNRRKNGDVFAEWATINTILGDHGEVHRRVCIFSDITERKKTEATIWRQANYDTLTALPNRRLFHDRLQQEMKMSRRDGSHLALLLVDLDRFKEVNDTLGHDVGDELLIEAARRISRCVRDSDTVARLGGDEFVVVMPNLRDNLAVSRIAQSIVDAMEEPFLVRGQAAYISASVGITIYPNDADDSGTLFKHADQAMYLAKDLGRNRFAFFTDSMQLAAQRRLAIGNDLRSALAAGQLEVYYQPIVDLKSGRIVKAEALLRWHHPTRGPISPTEFIPIAEETGLIGEIGDWVFRQALQAATHWCESERCTSRAACRAGEAIDSCPAQIAINKSPRQLLAGKNQGNWLDQLADPIGRSRCVAIEITEGLLLEDRPDVAHSLLACREAGVEVAIDDFGTGYSAMSYLKKFHIDYLKIDQSFVRDMGSDPGDRAIAEAIIVMAHKLGMKVVAEGVETVEQRDLLHGADCDYAQGFLFARPMPWREFENLLATQGTAELAA
ncbi:MAG: EAL domain-containing protein [Rhodocyclales bacterium]|nr:EAL domain-containing protein [Rhodocyclales bacterium]